MTKRPERFIIATDGIKLQGRLYMDARAYMDRTWLEVDLDALERNVRKCRSIIGPNCALTAVVKSDAYGLGAIPVARALWAMGVDMLAVACLSEARVLRAALPDAQIMILGDTPIRRMGEAAAMNLVCTVWTREQVCAAANCGLRVHAKIDTGFHRLGFDCRENALAELAGVLKQPGLRLEGIYSHLALVNREEDERQLERFDTARAYLRAQGITPRYFHIDDSIGMVRYPEHQLDMVRVGAFLYGVWPARYTDPITAEPVIAALKARVTHLSHLEPGEGAGYDYLFRAQRPTVLATVCAGYGDGYARAASKYGAQLSIRGQRAPLAGLACMDQLMADVTDIPGAAVGDVVTLFGGREIPIMEYADWADTNRNEAIARITARVPRLYLRGGEVVEVLDYMARRGGPEG